jgi:TetR/AcrR family transcriptional repressor of nem operon
MKFAQKAKRRYVAARQQPGGSQGEEKPPSCLIDNKPTSRYVFSMKPTARTKLLDAALGTIRAKGYCATSVDDLCARAGVTKGAFFHHFKSKDALAVAAADHWSETTSSLFADAPYHAPDDPLDRVLAYIEFRKELVRGDIPDFTCLVGTMVQEAYGASDEIREACWRSISGHAETLEADIAAAIKQYEVHGVTPQSLALFTQATIQGAFILAKAKNDPGVAIVMIGHLGRYVELLFRRPARARGISPPENP